MTSRTVHVRIIRRRRRLSVRTAVRLSLALAVLAAVIALAGPAMARPADYGAGVPACRHDSGDSARPVCVWHARRFGDGRGRSFVAIAIGAPDPIILPVRHRVAARLLAGSEVRP